MLWFVLCGAVILEGPGVDDAGRVALHADTIVARVVEAYGGRDRLDAVKAYMVDAQLTAHMRGTEATSRRLFQRPASLRVRIDYPDRTEERLLVG